MNEVLVQALNSFCVYGHVVGHNREVETKPAIELNIDEAGRDYPATEIDYSDTFPPSRRFVLTETKNENKDESQGPTPGWQKRVLPMETPYMDAEDSTFLPCGFSVKEIKALGDFPDYATLSGVPLPDPYPEFDINKALPRPYRPFRWSYHQTMCMSF